MKLSQRARYQDLKSAALQFKFSCRCQVVFFFNVFFSPCCHMSKCLWRRISQPAVPSLSVSARDIRLPNTTCHHQQISTPAPDSRKRQYMHCSHVIAPCYIVCWSCIPALVSCHPPPILCFVTLARPFCFLSACYCPYKLGCLFCVCPCADFYFVS